MVVGSQNGVGGVGPGLLQQLAVGSIHNVCITESIFFTDSSNLETINWDGSESSHRVENINICIYWSHNKKPEGMKLSLKRFGICSLHQHSDFEI